MLAHELASKGSQVLCDKLFSALKHRIPRVECSMTKQWCALFESGRNRFAYVAHRKTSDSIQIWCAGDVDSLVKNKYLIVIPRNKIRGGWEENFPARFTVDSDTLIDPAADLLFSISYKKT